jgi:hypothetical protein
VLPSEPLLPSETLLPSEPLLAFDPLLPSEPLLPSKPLLPSEPLRPPNCTMESHRDFRVTLVENERGNNLIKVERRSGFNGEIIWARTYPIQQHSPSSFRCLSCALGSSPLMSRRRLEVHVMDQHDLPAFNSRMRGYMSEFLEKITVQY